MKIKLTLVLEGSVSSIENYECDSYRFELRSDGCYVLETFKGKKLFQVVTIGSKLNPSIKVIK